MTAIDAPLPPAPILARLSKPRPLIVLFILMWVPLTWNVALATLMILGAAVVGTRAR